MCLSFEPSGSAATETEHLREALLQISSTTRGVNGFARDVERDKFNRDLQRLLLSIQEESEEIIKKSRKVLESMQELKDALPARRECLEYALLGRGQMPINSAEDAGNG